MNQENEVYKTSLKWMSDAWEYGLDAAQRTVLFWDILRKRGNNYLQHIREGQPPILAFDYEIILEGRALERPVNYALARIIPGDDVTIDPRKRPVVVIDPRAGHGPGIGGSKRDSEIGMAMKDGHPAYFVLFYAKPEPGQTLADVERAEAIFIEEVAKRHSDVGNPAVIGNCQAGWAMALLGADRPDVTGPIVMAGSPMSYWAGVDGTNPMRYTGGLLGGIWLSSLASDLGAGKFDGAHLVANFENLNPANTIWQKLYHVYANADTEEKRFLEFEKWWGGFFLMNAEEMHFIVDNLFVGNRLEQGRVDLEDDKRIDLKNLEGPLVLFASGGDNITPPQQALNWVAKVYGSTDEIKRCGQVITYLLHEDIGHLGIFVSGKVARKEHREIIGSLDMLEFLAPGLYEMVIDEGEPGESGVSEYNVRFVEREIDDILALDDGLEEEEAFARVAELSDFNDRAYKVWVSPWLRPLITERIAGALRRLHPLRWQRYMVSDLVPAFRPVAGWAEMVKADRRPAKQENLFSQLEKNMSDAIVDGLDYFRDVRDQSFEAMFYALFDNPWAKAWHDAGKKAEPAPAPVEAPMISMDREPAGKGDEIWLAAMEKGGFLEGVTRIMLAVAGADKVVDRREYLAAEEVVRAHPDMRRVDPSDFKMMVKDQARILQTDRDLALKSLTALLPGQEDRRAAMKIATRIAMADNKLADEEQAVLSELQALLEIETA